MSGTAIIAGRGGLPAALVAAMAEVPLSCALPGFQPDGVDVDHVFRIERLVPFLRLLEDAGVGRVIFAGAVTPALMASSKSCSCRRARP